MASRRPAILLHLAGIDRGRCRMPKKRAKYTGTLAKPIDLLKLPNHEDAVRDDFAQRLALLFRHFGIDLALPPENLWFQLAVKLAVTHVPGFGVRSLKQKGAKRKWTPEERRALVEAVDAQNKGKGLKVAIRSAMKQPGWKWKKNVPSIETRYHEAVRHIERVKFMRSHPQEPLAAMMESDFLERERSKRPKRKRTTKKST
jgi:hypothetical protein